MSNTNSPLFLIEDRDEVNLQYEAILAYCKHNDTCFVDGEFPHNTKSYKKETTDIDGMLASFGYTHGIKWIRPTQFLTCQPIAFDADTNSYLVEKPVPWTFYENAQTTGVQQKDIGDCGLIAALAHLPNHPVLLSSIFLSRRELCDYGVYQVRLCVFGEWKTILLDDWFPALHNVMRTACSEQNQLWVSLIEKAIAKVLGSFTSLHGFHGHCALSMLTGAPSYQTGAAFDWKDDVDKLWRVLMDAYHSGFLVTCATALRPHPKAWMDAEGLVFSHVYTLLEVGIVDGHRLIRLRNPNEFPLWRGRWSIFWTEFPIDLKGVMLLSRSDDAAFWMDIEDFHKRIKCLYICKYRPSWSTIRMRLLIGGSVNERHTMLQLVITQKCSVCIEAWLAVNKKHTEPQRTFWLTIYQIKPDGDVGELENISFCYQCSEDIELDFGVYAIAIFKWWNKAEDYNVVVNSSKAVSVEMAPLNQFLLQKAYYNLILRKGVQIKTANHNVKLIKYEDDNIYLALAENYNKEKHFYVQTNCTHKVMKDYFFSRTPKRIFCDVISPMSRQLLIGVQVSQIEQLAADFRVHFEYYISDKPGVRFPRMKKASAIVEGQYHHYMSRIEN